MSDQLSPKDHRRFEAEILPQLDVLYRMARSVCRDADLGDDIAQESFLKAIRGFAGFRPGSNSRSWLARIVQNTCRDHWRSQARRGDLGSEEELEAAAAAQSAEVDWQPDVVRDAFDDDIELALQALPRRWRAAIQLVDIEGWSYDEAAESLEIAPGSLRSALHRARKSLYKSLYQASQAPGGAQARVEGE